MRVPAATPLNSTAPPMSANTDAVALPAIVISPLAAVSTVPPEISGAANMPANTTLPLAVTAMAAGVAVPAQTMAPEASIVKTEPTVAEPPKATAPEPEPTRTARPAAEPAKVTAPWPDTSRTISLIGLPATVISPETLPPSVVEVLPNAVPAKTIAALAATAETIDAELERRVSRSLRKT